MNALAEVSLAASNSVVSHWIGGRCVLAQGPQAPIFNPTLGKQIRAVSLATTEEVGSAVACALNAFANWASVPPPRRARIMFRFLELLNQHAGEIARTLSEEHGKTIPDAAAEIARGMEVVEFACAAPQTLKGEFSDSVGSGVDSFSMRQPLGVVVGITPFNFPAMVPMWMFPVALVCGNTFILKPSERDPSVSMWLAQLLRDAGLPDGVFNVVHGDKGAVDALLAHPQIAAVSFVGSTPVAQYIHMEAIRHGKRVQALGGAKNHMVILPDADMSAAAEAVTGAAFGSAGERCMAISVAVAVGDETANRLMEKLSARARALKVGAPDEAGTEMGPLVTKAHLERVCNYIRIGEQEGARLILDGREFKLAGREGGFFLGPTLFDDVRPNMRIYREEIFGPVLCVVRVPDLNSALRLINEHEFANGAAIFTQSGEAAREFARQVEVGMVGVNVPIPVPMAFHSFGGWRRSLFGDHAMHGAEGVRFYTRLKTITQRWPGTEGLKGDFSIPARQ